MNKRKSSISKASSYEAIGEFWDTHDLSDYWDKTKPATFKIDIKSEVIYYAIDKTLSERLQRIARKRGVPTNTLINLWIQEKLGEQRVISRK